MECNYTMACTDMYNVTGVCKEMYCGPNEYPIYSDTCNGEHCFCCAPMGNIS